MVFRMSCVLFVFVFFFTYIHKWENSLSFYFYRIYQVKQLPRQDQIRDLLSLCLYRMHKYIIIILRDRNGQMVCANVCLPATNCLFNLKKKNSISQKNLAFMAIFSLTLWLWEGVLVLFLFLCLFFISFP